MPEVRVELPDDLLAAVDLAATQAGTSRGEVIAAAIADKLERPDRARRQTALENLRRSLAGGSWQAEVLVRAERDR